MKNRTKYLVMGAAAVLIIGVSAFLLLYSPDQNQDPVSVPAPDISVPDVPDIPEPPSVDVIEPIGSTPLYEIEDRELSRNLGDPDSGETLVSLSISYPSFSQDGEQFEVINNYYDNLYEKLTIYAEIDLFARAQENYQDPNIEFFAYSLSETYRVTRVKEDILSIVRTQELFSGGAHGGEQVFAESFLMENGGKLTLSDLFTVEPETYMDTIFSAVEREIDQNADNYYENAHELLRDVYNSEDFYLTDTALTVFYQEYALAPYAMGPQYFTIPFADIEDMIRELE